ncbi:MAG: hypothetical protein ACRC7V_02715 [Lachnospiraceae bacterium]
MDTCTLHIAICDDNIADRKQMERLLDREVIAQQANHNTVYTNFFGSSNSLLQATFHYDAYFLDICHDSINAYDVAKTLRANGIFSPIVFCNSKIDYKLFSPSLDDTMHINKPIHANELTSIIHEIIEVKKAHTVPKLEFRNTFETFYVIEEDFYCCTGTLNQQGIKVTLKDKQKKEASCFLHNVWMDMESFTDCYMINDTTIINLNYVSKISLFRLTMMHGEHFKITPATSFELKKILQSKSQ